MNSEQKPSAKNRSTGRSTGDDFEIYRSGRVEKILTGSISDLPNASNLETTLLADDTNLHISHNNIKNLQSVVTNEIKKIDTWMKLNKLTINYKKSCYMLVGKKRIKLTSFKLYINHYPIELKKSITYLEIHLDRELSWKTHIDYLAKKLSKVCGMIYKLRHYIPLSTLRIVYHSMFHSHIQYSLINWGRAAKSHYHKLSILQNKILRAYLFRPRRYETNLLYSRFIVFEARRHDQNGVRQIYV